VRLRHVVIKNSLACRLTSYLFPVLRLGGSGGRSGGEVDNLMDHTSEEEIVSSVSLSDVSGYRFGPGGRAGTSTSRAKH
jgi:hypothetical protein